MAVRHNKVILKKRVVKNSEKTRPARPVRFRRETPLGVKVISILMFISVAVLAVIGILLIIMGIIFTVTPVKVANLPTDFPIQLVPFVTSTLFGITLVVISFILLLIALAEYIISLNLWRLKNWARIIIIVVSVLSAISALINIFRGQFSAIISLAIDIIVAVYLLFNTEVKRAFR
jgi:hypothetical protein